MKLLITDMDGTVVDSMSFLRELAIALAAADDHSDVKMREVYDETFGRPISAQYEEWNRRYATADDVINVRKLTRLYESVHLLAATHFHLTDFGRSLAAFRHDIHQDWRFALVTSTNKLIVDRMTQLRHIDWQFIGGYEGKGTEKAKQITRCIEQCGCTPADVVYVGDAPSDQQIAVALDIAYRFPSGTLLSSLLGVPVFAGTDAPSRLMGSV